MRIDATLAELTSAAALQQAAAAIADSEGDFLQLVELLRLDKANDFVFSNLRGVDFTGSDLRGFDFSGADLRDSFGADVLFDHTTILTNADVHGSCFATYKRERDLFSAVPNAERMYEALKSGDTYEVSEWIHSRFSGNDGRPAFLREADDETAAILCQKLLTDDIDLTKRSDLFHHLTSIAVSTNGLRELLLEVIARHVGNVPVVTKFITIAGNLYREDPLICQTFLKLTTSVNENIREAVFGTFAGTRFFVDHLPQLEEAFLSRENRNIRQRFLRSAGISLGRSALSTINLQAAMTDVPLDQILDFHELLDENMATEIAMRLKKREEEIADRFSENRSARSKAGEGVSGQDIESVLRRQEEVMATAPVIDALFASKMPDRYKSARARVKSQMSRSERSVASRISRAHSRRHS